VEATVDVLEDPDLAPVLAVDLPVSNVQDARRFIAGVLTRWRLTRLTSEVVLVGHELIANALRHGTPPAVLRLSRLADAVVVEVGDASRAVPRIPEIDNTSSISGRGLRIVTSLARGWGVRLHHEGKIVWAEIPARE
jgi:hypothetical protein